MDQARRKHLEQLGIDLGLAQIDHVIAHLLAEDAEDLALINESEPHQHLVQPLVGTLSRGLGGLEIRRGNLALFAQNFANTHGWIPYSLLRPPAVSRRSEKPPPGLARGSGRPLWVAESRDGVFFASTRLALEVVARYCGLDLSKHELAEGTWLELRGGRIVRSEQFTPDLEYVEANPLPSVRAPQERDVCLTRLAALAAAA